MIRRPECQHEAAGMEAHTENTQAQVIFTHDFPRAAGRVAGKTLQKSRGKSTKPTHYCTSPLSCNCWKRRLSTDDSFNQEPYGRGGEEEVFFPGLSLTPSAYCLVNRLTRCQRSLCECVLAEGQSDPLACLSQRGKWRPWYAISGRNVQTVWLPRQAWLAVALPKLCPRNYLFGPKPEGLVLQSLVVVYLFIHLHLVHTGTLRNISTA